MTFCELDKLSLICDTFTPGTEMRREDEVKIVTLVLRIDPLTPRIAEAIDPTLRRLLFKAAKTRKPSDIEPAPLLREVLIALPLPRQLLTVYATRDSPQPSIAFDQVKIGRVRARLDTKAARWFLKVKATFGPCGPNDLAFVQEWFETERFVTFTPAEGLLEFEGPLDDDDAEEEPAAPPQPVDAGRLLDVEVTPQNKRRPH